MNSRKLIVEFVTVFAVALVTGSLVTFLWNFIVPRPRLIELARRGSVTPTSFYDGRSHRSNETFTD
jgi:hypothetical protein